MFTASAEFYDLIYSTFKDYPGEAAQIAGLLRTLNPHCHTVIAQEVHELGLFTTAELLQTFRDAGLDADYDPKGLTDRGLYIAKAAA